MNVGKHDLMASVILLTANPLCNNPRVNKEAAALAQAGYQVTVLGAWLDIGLKQRDQALLQALPFIFKPVIDWTLDNFITRLQRQFARARNKLGALFYRATGIGNAWQFGYAYYALLRAARATHADLYIAHSEAGMLVANKLLNEGYRVGLDMEDWFSEDLTPDARRQRPIKVLRQLEANLLKNGHHSTCPSQAMSAVLAMEFDVSAPLVVYNAFPYADRLVITSTPHDRRNLQLVSVHWYSQTIGAGRGLEDLLAALRHLRTPIELHLRGKPVQGFDVWLAAQMPPAWLGQVFVHDTVVNDLLLARIAEHDIGFAGEIPYSQNKDLTVSNKILHYLLGGLAVVASDTAGQREVADLANSTAAKGEVAPVVLYPSGDVLALAAQLNWLIESKERLLKAKVAALAAAKRVFCWENQIPVLLGSVEAALAAGINKPSNALKA